MKREHRIAARRRALREQRYPLAAPKMVDEIFTGALRCAAASSLKKQRVRMLAQPAYQWPITYIILGDKGSGRDRIDDEDVEKGNVICDDQTMRQRRSCLQFAKIANADPKHGEQLARPALLEREAVLFIQPRIKECDGNTTLHQVQGDAKQSKNCTQMPHARSVRDQNYRNISLL